MPEPQLPAGYAVDPQQVQPPAGYQPVDDSTSTRFNAAFQEALDSGTIDMQDVEDLRDTTSLQGRYRNAKHAVESEATLLWDEAKRELNHEPEAQARGFAGMPPPTAQQVQTPTGYQLIDQSAPDSGATALGGALLYAAQQDPVKYAKRLQLQKLTGIPPQVSEGNEEQVKVAADAKAIDPQAFTSTNPRTAQWAANPDNAAVSGVPEIQRLGGIEQNVKQMDAMYPMGAMSAYTPTMWESLKGKLSNAWDETKQSLYAYPLTRMAVSTVGGLAGSVGDMGGFIGWHGDGPTKQNMLQSVESGLKPENVFKSDPYAGVADYAKSNGMDQVAPLLASMAVGAGEGSAVTWAAKTFGWSERAAKVATALSVGATFSAQQGGAAYTQVAGAGGDDAAARLAANRTFAINLPANFLGGFADMVPGLKNSPLLAQAGTGALMGASGQVGSNIVTGQRWNDGLAMAAGKGAAIQAGLHLGMSQFHANLAQAVEAANASELKTRSPQTFEDAIGAIAGGGPSLRIPVEEFNRYFAGQKIDPQAAAEGLGATNYAEAHLSGGDVEVPKAGYLAELEHAHQMGLFPHIVDPVTDLTPTQWEQGHQELAEWEANGGTAKLQADVAAADAETAASPEHAAVKEDLRGRYEAAGEAPEVAEALATKDANVVTNLARGANLKPSEVLAMYNPKVTVGEAPVTAADLDSQEVLKQGGNFGTKHEQFYHDAKGAIEQLLKDKSGDAIGALHHPEVGDIDLIYGKEGESEKGYAGGFGLAKIAAKHPEVLDDLQGFMDKLKVDSKSANRINLSNAEGRAGVRLDLDGVSKRWLVTAFLKDEVLGAADRERSAGTNHAEPAPGKLAGQEAPDDILHQSQIPAWFKRIPAPAEGEAHPSLVDIRERAAASGVPLTEEQDAAAKEAFEAASRGDDEVWSTAQEKYQALRDADPRMAELRAAQGKFAKLQAEVTDDPTPENLTALTEAGKAVRAERDKLAANAKRPVTFTTAKGSVYTVNEDGTTTRNKAFRPEHGEAEQGPQPRSEQTFYVSPADAVKLGEIQARSDSTRALVVREGSAGIQYLDGKDKGKIEKRTFVPIKTEPAVGLTPIETWEGGSRVHFGNEITGITDGTMQAAQPRGWFRALPDGGFEISKTKIGDLSTFVHEPAHAYLHLLRELAARDGASETLKGDYATVLKFLDVNEGEPLTREQQEKWARANEQYLREGKAPSAALKGVFQRFAIWLGSVYQRASDLGVELSPDIRGVFDRLYAAEEGVNRAEAEAGPQLFKSPEEAGFTQQQFDEYAAQHEVSVEQAKAEILSKLNEAAERDRTAAWREEQRNVRQAMTDVVDADPAQKAIRSLQKGELQDGTPLTINRQLLVDQFGEDRVKALQKVHKGIYRLEGGTDAETAAELHGFGSGEEMVRAMEATPRRKVAIDAATREYMTAKHGDIRYDGTLGEQARLALENDHKANMLHGQLIAAKQKIAEMKGTKAALRAIDVAPIAAYREMAEQAIARKSVADLQPTRKLDAMRKYSREGKEALIAGDAVAYAEALHKELLNHYLFREEQKAKEFVDRTFEPFRKRAQGKTVQESLGKAGPEYRAQFNNLMARYGVAFVPRSEAPEGTLAEWASGQYDMGKEPAIDPAILNETRAASYRSIPMSELHQVHDALQNIKALAYQELRMTVNGRRVEFAKATADMIKRATESLELRPSRVLKRNATFGEKAGEFVQRGDALLMRTERLLEWLDGGKTGPWHDNLWHLAADSQGREYGLQEQVTKRIGDSLEALPKEQRLKMTEKVMIAGITEPITRHDLISMALNMGNDGNFDRLSKTFEAHGWNPDALEQVKGSLTREEWQHVQNLWEMLKPLGEHMKAMERRLTGVPPAMVKPTPFRVEFADGTHMDLDGGYYPIMMDPEFSKVGATVDAAISAQNLMETGYGRAETSKGYTKGRTGYGGPLLLNHEEVLTAHTAKVIKDITHREFMLTANKLLMDQGVRNTIRSTLGAGYEEQMMPWLRTIINDRNGSTTQGLGHFSRWMRTARTNMVMATIPFKIGTSLLQWTHAPRMLLSTNAGSFPKSLMAFMARPSEMTEQIRALSPNEMKFRGDDLDRDIREAMNGQPGVQKKIAEVGGMSIKYTDHLLSFPLWHSVYQDALREHIDLPEDEAQYQAVQKADSAVRLGLGSASPKDLPPIMRNDEFAKFFTTFYSFHNGIYGQVRDIAHQVNGWSDVPKMTYGMALAVVVPSLIGSLVTGHGPKDDENVGLWAAKRALLFSSDTIPIVRDVAAAMDRGGDVKFNPLMDVLSKGTKTVMAATADKEDKDWTGIGLGALETAGDLGGVPGTAQAMKPLRYMDSVSKGKVENPNVWDAFVGSTSSRKR